MSPKASTKSRLVRRVLRTVTTEEYIEEIPIPSVSKTIKKSARPSKRILKAKVKASIDAQKLDAAVKSTAKQVKSNAKPVKATVKHENACAKPVKTVTRPTTADAKPAKAAVKPVKAAPKAPKAALKTPKTAPKAPKAGPKTPKAAPKTPKTTPKPPKAIAKTTKAAATPKKAPTKPAKSPAKANESSAKPTRSPPKPVESSVNVKGKNTHANTTTPAKTRSRTKNTPAAKAKSKPSAQSTPKSAQSTAKPAESSVKVKANPSHANTTTPAKPRSRTKKTPAKTTPVAKSKPKPSAQGSPKATQPTAKLSEPSANVKGKIAHANTTTPTKPRSRTKNTLATKATPAAKSKSKPSAQSTSRATSSTAAKAKGKVTAKEAAKVNVENKKTEAKVPVSSSSTRKRKLSASSINPANNCSVTNTTNPPPVKRPKLHDRVEPSVQPAASTFTTPNAIAPAISRRTVKRRQREQTTPRAWLSEDSNWTGPHSQNSDDSLPDLVEPDDDSSASGASPPPRIVDNPQYGRHTNLAPSRVQDVTSSLRPSPHNTISRGSYRTVQTARKSAGVPDPTSFYPNPPASIIERPAHQSARDSHPRIDDTSAGFSTDGEWRVIHESGYSPDRFHSYVPPMKKDIGVFASRAAAVQRGHQIVGSMCGYTWDEVRNSGDLEVVAATSNRWEICWSPPDSEYSRVTATRMTPGAGRWVVDVEHGYLPNGFHSYVAPTKNTLGPFSSRDIAVGHAKTEIGGKSGLEWLEVVRSGNFEIRQDSAKRWEGYWEPPDSEYSHVIVKLLTSADDAENAINISGDDSASDGLQLISSTSHPKQTAQKSSAFDWPLAF